MTSAGGHRSVETSTWLLVSRYANDCRVAQDNEYNPSQLQIPFIAPAKAPELFGYWVLQKNVRFKKSEY